MTVISASLVLKLADGRVVQRPLNDTERAVVIPILCGLDGGPLRVVAAEGVEFTHVKKVEHPQ